jgi:hypothetical protein
MISALTAMLQTIFKAILAGIRVVFLPRSLNQTTFKNAVSMDDSKTVKERVEGWCESKATELTHVSISVSAILPPHRL